MINFISYVSLFLLLFDLDMPFLRGVGSSVYSALLSLSFILLNINLCNSRINYIIKEFSYTILIFFMLFVYVLLRLLFSSAEDLSYLGSGVKATVLFISSILYLIAFDSKYLFDRLFNVFFLNACVAMFIGTFQEYQYIVDIFKPNGGMQLIGYVPYRNAFLSGSGYFGIGAPFALASAFIFSYLVLAKKLSFLNFIKIVFIFISAIFAARTSFLCIGMTMLYLIFFEKKINLIWIVVLMVLLLIVILNLDGFESYRYWVFEIFNNGISSSATGEVLLTEFVKFPNDIYSWFFGDGKYVTDNGSYYMNTDIGYLRHWFFGGVFFMISILLIPFSMLLANNQKIFLFLIIPICFLLHFKGVFIYNNPTSTPLLVLISHILYKSSRKI